MRVGEKGQVTIPIEFRGPRSGCCLEALWSSAAR